MEAEKGELQAPEHGKAASGELESGMAFSRESGTLLILVEMTGARKRPNEAVTGSEPTTPSVRSALALQLCCA